MKRKLPGTDGPERLAAIAALAELTEARRCALARLADQLTAQLVRAPSRC